MQPSSIKKFEAIYLAAWCVGLIATFLAWDANAILASQVGRQLGLGLYSATIMVGLLIPLTLWYLAARCKSNIARWLIVALFALQALGVVWAFLTASFSVHIASGLATLVFVLRAIAVRFLLTPESRAWFSAPAVKLEVPEPEQND